jgi:hypothetical protein
VDLAVPEALAAAALAGGFLVLRRYRAAPGFFVGVLLAVLGIVRLGMSDWRVERVLVAGWPAERIACSLAILAGGALLIETKRRLA